MRQVTWCLVEEVNSADWGIGGQCLATEAVHSLAARRPRDGMTSNSRRPLSADAVVFLPKNAKALLRKAFVARPERFELPTFGSVDRRSIQLSYGRP
jgi:hypothetical protein